jgi:3-hydroxyisobutyrate dehydrogenase-like beta-hydroxyacid dehydrogenase
MRSAATGTIGLGLLGSAVAARLRAAGCELRGYDSDPRRLCAFVESGGVALDSASAVFAACEVTFLALPDSNVVASLLEAAPTLTPGATVIDLTTGDPERMALFGSELAARGVEYLDATVGGSSEQVREGDAIVMVGGEGAAVDRHRGLLAFFAREIFHVGLWGSGARMKLAMNLVLGLNRAALAEGLAFAAACGLAKEDALRVFRSGPAWSRVMDTKGRRMIDRDFAPAARLSQHRKDVDLILAAAARNGAQTPLSRVHRDLLTKVERAGFGGEDNSAILQAFETN